jgi:predicted dehydrogenase
MKRLRMAVIGVGHLGKEHARILAGFPDVELTGVVDVNFEQAEAVARKTGTQAFSDYRRLLGNVDAATIVVPTSRHLQVAREFLQNGTPILVEKPLAPSLAAANELVDLAARNGVALQVGHIERFNPAFEELQNCTLTPRLVRAQRMGPFTGRSTDIGVVLDLMIHDLDLILTLANSPVRSVAATGISVFGAYEDVASARIEFQSGCVVDLTASRASPNGQRAMQIWAAEGYAEVDFAQRRLTLVQPSARVRMEGLDPTRLDPASRARVREELFTRHLEMLVIDGKAQDQLTAELRHFVTCVQTGAKPRSCGAEARDAVALAEMILQQIHASNQPRQEASGLLFPHHVDQDAA